MLSHPSTCKGCPLEKVGHGFVPDEVRSSKVAIIAMNPSKDDATGRHLVGYAGRGNPLYETTHPRPFLGHAGWLLENTYLPLAGLRREDVSLHHILKCHLPHRPNWDTLLAAQHHCVKHHLNTSDEVQVLITVGEDAWKLYHPELPLHEWRGFLSPSPLKNGAKIYATTHPHDHWWKKGEGSVDCRDPHTRFITRLDWKKVPKILSGEWPLPIPEQCIASPYTRGQFTRLLEEASCQPELMVDTEFIVSNGLLTHVGASWSSVQHGKSIVKGFQLEWVRGSATPVERSIFMRWWNILCQKVPMGFWNAKADLPILEQNLHRIPSKIEDPMQAHSCLWPDMPHDYEFVASIYGKYPKLKHLNKENILLYHWGDMIDLVHIWDALKKEFEYEKGCEHKYRSQRLPLIPILLECEARGIRVSQEKINEKIPRYETLSQAAQILAQAYCGFPINIGSHGQLLGYLGSSESLRLRSMDQDTLATYRAKYLLFDVEEEENKGFSVEYVCTRVSQGAHPLLETRTMYAKNEKIVSSYLGPLQDVGRIYPTINIHTQNGNRHSITNPSLPTFPEDIRDIVVPDPGYVWIGFDWDAQEPRIQWGESGSKVLEKAFLQGEDIHTSFVCNLYGWKRPQDPRNPHTSDVDHEWRKEHGWKGKDDPRRVFAKQVRYEVNYSSKNEAYNAQQKATRMGISPDVAKRAAEVLLNSDPELREWFRKVMKEGEKTRIVRSWGGGRRVFYWADGMSKIPLNEMRNYPLQAGGADLNNLTIVEIATKIPQAKFVYDCHDSQYWQCPKEEWESIYPQLRAIAEQPRLIGGRMIPFPGTFKMIDEDGVVVKL